MAYRNTTGKPVYVNQDRSKVVDEDSGEAAFVLVGVDGELPDEQAAKYGLRGGAAPKADPLADARKAHDEAMARGATEEARSHRNRMADLEAQADAARAPKAQAPAMADAPKDAAPKAADKAVAGPKEG